MMNARAEINPKRAPKKSKKKSAKAFWNKQLHTWHWISGAISLVGTILFSFTGITLNHAADIKSTPTVVERVVTLPEELLQGLSTGPDEGIAPVPEATVKWIRRELDANIRPRKAEWSDVDIYIGMPGPGRDGWLSIDRETGEIIYETTGRGTIAYLNDLHKGRDTGTVWAWFIDIFAVACIIFCLTGLWLLQMHAKKRKSTWPLVIAGTLLPAALALLFIH